VFLFSGQEIIGHMLFGYFDARAGWEIALEQKWMEQKKLKYKDHTEGRSKGQVSNWKKGRIAKIIMETKETQVKRIRKAGERKKVRVCKKRKNETEKTMRRKKGEFHVEQEQRKCDEEDVRMEKESFKEDIGMMLKRAAIQEGLSHEQYMSLFHRMQQMMKKDEELNSSEEIPKEIDVECEEV